MSRKRTATKRSSSSKGNLCSRRRLGTPRLPPRCSKRTALWTVSREAQALACSARRIRSHAAVTLAGTTHPSIRGAPSSPASLLKTMPLSWRRSSTKFWVSCALSAQANSQQTPPTNHLQPQTTTTLYDTPVYKQFSSIFNNESVPAKQFQFQTHAFPELISVYAPNQAVLRKHPNNSDFKRVILPPLR